MESELCEERALPLRSGPADGGICSCGATRRSLSRSLSAAVVATVVVAAEAEAEAEAAVAADSGLELVPELSVS